MNREAQNNASAGDREKDEETPQPEYTQEQVLAVHRILKLSNMKASLYEILDVPKDATEADIHKAVRELARAVHPDKNSAPGATEAMKAVNCAAAVLLIPEKRQEYDQLREQNRQPNLTPEETFNVFFSPESLDTLRKMMPWLAIGAGVFLIGAGTYKLLTASRREPEQPSAENRRRRNPRQ